MSNYIKENIVNILSYLWWQWNICLLNSNYLNLNRFIRNYLLLHRKYGTSTLKFNVKYYSIFYRINNCVREIIFMLFSKYLYILQHRLLLSKNTDILQWIYIYWKLYIITTMWSLGDRVTWSDRFSFTNPPNRQSSKLTKALKKK